MLCRKPTYTPKTTWQSLLLKLNSYVPVRQRDVLTRDGHLRLRYVLSGTTTALMMMTVSGIATMNVAKMISTPSSDIRMEQLASIEPASGNARATITEQSGVAVDERLAISQKRLQRYKNNEATDTVTQASEEYAALVQPAQSEATGPREEILTIGKGDTLGELLQRAGLSSAEAHNAVQAMKKHYDPRDLKLGQTVHLRYAPDVAAGGYQLASLQMDVDSIRSVSLSRAENDDGFAASVTEKEILKKVEARRAEIETSLYGSALKAGLPRAIVAEAIRVYSYDVDFQRDVRRGDTLEILYENYETADGQPVKTGDILFARINVGGQSMVAYRYEGKDGVADFYTADGKSLRKAIMMTPVDGARISSGFGMRRHPVLGYSKMHKGVDFAAPTGTPVYAAGSGTIEKASRFSSYGNYVRIRHSGSTKTAYAHLSRYGKGIAPGVRVKQGQIIGYIGTTGRSTGPHLHFEVLEGSKQVNPRNVKMQQGEALKGTELANFKAQIRKLDGQFASLTRNVKMASAEQATVN